MSTVLLSYSDNSPIDAQGVWTNDSDAFDGGTTTFATTTTTGSKITNFLHGSGLYVLSFGGGVISKVELYMYGYSTTANSTLYGTAYTEGLAEELGTVSINSDTGVDSSYVELLEPSGGWSSHMIGTLEAKIYATIDGSDIAYAGRIEVRVTYSTLNNYWGAETGGIEEVTSASAGLEAVSTYSTSGSYSYFCNSNSGIEYGEFSPFESVADAGGKYIHHFKIRRSGTMQTGAQTIISYREGAVQFLGLGWPGTSTDIIIVDANGSTIRTITGNKISLDTWVNVTVVFEHADSSTVEVFFDDVSAGEDTAQDLNNGGTFDTIRIEHTLFIGSGFYYDDAVLISGASSSEDRFSDWEIFSYRSNLSTAAGDTGDALDEGTWNLIQTIPFAITEQAGYIGTPRAGSVNTDGIGIAGPLGCVEDNEDNFELGHFDGSNGIIDTDNVWNNDANAADGSISTYANTSILGSETLNTLELKGTNISPTGDTVIELEARVLFTLTGVDPVARVRFYLLDADSGKNFILSEAVSPTWTNWLSISNDISRSTVGIYDARCFIISGSLASLGIYKIEFRTKNQKVFGDIIASKGIWNMMRGGGGGTTHNFLLGNSVDGTTADTKLTTTAYTNYFVVSENPNIIPVADEYASIGFGVDGGQDFNTAGMLTTILHVPSIDTGNPPLEAEVGSFILTGKTAGRSLGGQTGSFALTGQAAALKQGFILETEVGSFALTGHSAGRSLGGQTGSFVLTGIPLEFTYNSLETELPVDAGEFLLTGIAANLNQGFVLDTEVGEFLLTGQPADLDLNSILGTEIGEFLLTGQPADFRLDVVIPAETGEFILTGIDAAFPTDGILPVDAGEFLLTGIDAGFASGKVLKTEVGEFLLTGVDAAFPTDGILAVDAGEFLLTGTAAALQYQEILQVDAGEFILTGQGAGFLAGSVLPTEVGEFILTGVDAAFPTEGILAVDVGEFILTGIAADLKAKEIFELEVGEFLLTGQDADFLSGRYIGADSGSFSISGQPTNLLTSRVLDVEVGSYTLTGEASDYIITRTILADVGSYVLTGIDAALEGELNAPLLADVGTFIISGQSVLLNYNQYLPACLGYSFKREAVVYVVYGGFRYQIDISEVNFSQTFQEHSYSIKTIQTANMFEQSVINMANPANFDLTFPAIRERDLRILFDRALDYQPFDLYIESHRGNFEVKSCIITNANFIIESQRPLSMGIQGEGTKVSMVSGDAPGTLVERSTSRTYNRISDLDIELAGTASINNALASVSVELQNEVQWTPYTHVNGAEQNVTMYPSAYTIRKRILAGSFTKYLLDTETVDLFKWNKNTSLTLFAGQEDAGTFFGFNMNIANCSYTNRIGTGEVFTQSFDWRMTQNPTNLSDIITYTTIPPSDIFTNDFGPEFY